MSLTSLSIQQIRNGLAEKKFSARDLADAYLETIEKKSKDLNAYLAVRENAVREEAEKLDARIAAGEALPALAGAPVALKDNILVAGERATAGSKILEHYTASYDAHVVTKLRGAGALILGKTNCDEFAMGSSNENSAFGPVKNPHDTTRVPGGSSGGSAAAVASSMALAALGSDTGGSVKQPAALCGVVGLRPTYGAVSRSGLIALASSLDQISPFGRTVEDTARVFDAIRGKDPMDATSADTEYDETLVYPDPERTKSLTVGIPKEYFVDGLDPQVGDAVDSVREELEAAGIKTKEVSLPHTKYALSCYYIVLPAEASANLARLDGIRYARVPEALPAGRQAAHAKTLGDIYFEDRGAGFGPEPKRRIILGTFVLSSGYYDAYYDKAQRVRTLIGRDFENAFKEVDVILGPTTPTPAFKLGEKANDPLAMYLSDIFTIPSNLAGLPGMSVPVKRVTGLPIGFQLIGRKWKEADILGLGMLYERL